MTRGRGTRVALNFFKQVREARHCAKDDGWAAALRSLFSRSQRMVRSVSDDGSEGTPKGRKISMLLKFGKVVAGWSPSFFGKLKGMLVAVMDLGHRWRCEGEALARSEKEEYWRMLRFLGRDFSKSSSNNISAPEISRWVIDDGR
jgi:hypothetical protein